MSSSPQSSSPPLPPPLFASSRPNPRASARKLLPHNEGLQPVPVPGGQLPCRWVVLAAHSMHSGRDGGGPVWSAATAAVGRVLRPLLHACCCCCRSQPPPPRATHHTDFMLIICTDEPPPPPSPHGASSADTSRRDQAATATSRLRSQGTASDLPPGTPDNSRSPKSAAAGGTDADAQLSAAVALSRAAAGDSGPCSGQLHPPDDPVELSQLSSPAAAAADAEDACVVGDAAAAAAKAAFARNNRSDSTTTSCSSDSGVGLSTAATAAGVGGADSNVIAMPVHGEGAAQGGGLCIACARSSSGCAPKHAAHNHHAPPLHTTNRCGAGCRKPLL